MRCTGMSQPTIFISYSHRDEEEKNALLAHLGVLQGAGLVDVWSDDRIGGGADWESDIRATMARARVAVLLISVHFLSSDFIRRREVPELLRRRDSEDLHTFPVIAKACAWRRVEWLRKMNVRPKNGAPVWRDGGRHVDEELARIVEEIAEVLEQSRERLSPVVEAALGSCLARNFRPDQIDDHAEVLRVVFRGGRVGLDRLQEHLASLADDTERLTRLRRLLREPALQRLARRAGQRDAYERLVFSP